ncbi:MAG: hypothetical protein ACXW0Z_02460 [Gemmatirosa sp.]
MSPSRPVASEPPVSESAWSIAWLSARWPRVQVDLVDVAPDRRGTLVRAIVRLGELTPADVHVELFEDAPDDSDPRPGAWPMWSSRSYDNGSFVFEASVPSAPAPDGWLVRVRPRTIPAPAVQQRAVAPRAPMDA